MAGGWIGRRADRDGSRGSPPGGARERARPAFGASGLRAGRGRAGRMNGRGRHSVRVAFGVTGIRRGWPSV